MNIHIIAGGGGGIGLECAKKFKEEMVLIAGRREDALKNSCNELKKIGINASSHVCDIKDATSVKDLFIRANKLGKIKTVINSAGVSSTQADCETIIQINLIGSYHIIQSMLPYVTHGNVVISIASMMGYLAPLNLDKYLTEPLKEGAAKALKDALNDDPENAYKFTKRGVQLLTKRFAPSFGERGGRILSVSPGIISTKMGNEALVKHAEIMESMRLTTPLKRFGQPAEVANLIYFLTQEQSNFLTGCDYLVDGGLLHQLANS